MISDEMFAEMKSLALDRIRACLEILLGDPSPMGDVAGMIASNAIATIVTSELACDQASALAAVLKGCELGRSMRNADPALLRLLEARGEVIAAVRSPKGNA